MDNLGLLLSISAWCSSDLEGCFVRGEGGLLVLGGFLAGVRGCLVVLGGVLGVESVLERRMCLRCYNVAQMRLSSPPEVV